MAKITENQLTGLQLYIPVELHTKFQIPWAYCALFAAIHYFSDDHDGGCTETNEFLGEQIGLQTRSVQRGIKLLAGHKLIRVAYINKQRIIAPLVIPGRVLPPVKALPEKQREQILENRKYLHQVAPLLGNWPKEELDEDPAPIEDFENMAVSFGGTKAMGRQCFLHYRSNNWRRSGQRIVHVDSIVRLWVERELSDKKTGEQITVSIPTANGSDKYQ